MKNQLNKSIKIKEIYNLMQDWKIKETQLTYKMNDSIKDPEKWHELNIQQNMLNECINDLWNVISNKLKH